MFFRRDCVLDADDGFSGKRRLTTLVQADDAFSVREKNKSWH
jgi:hypothetical protein